jgi:DNA-binding MarR family transcriptional regulator
VSEAIVQGRVQGPAAISAETVQNDVAQPFCESPADGPESSLRASQLTLLRALVEAGGSLHVAALVRRHGGSLAVARASTSRALRRLWRAGLVELFDKHGRIVDRSRARGVYVTRVSITAAGAEAVNTHESMSVNRAADGGVGNA